LPTFAKSRAERLSSHRFQTTSRAANGKPHSRTAHTIGDETAGLAARRKTQIFEAVANGGGLSYMHSGMYGRGSVRQMRSTAPAQIPGTKISVCRGVGGMFTASGTIIMSSRHSAVSVSIAR